MVMNMSIRQLLAMAFAAAYAAVIAFSFSNPALLWLLALLIPLNLVLVQNLFQKKHAILRNYPILGYLRYFFESIRPEMRQYFFESDLDGKPFSRRQRSIVSSGRRT